MDSRRLMVVVLAVLLVVGLALLVIDTIYVVHYYWLAALLSLGPELVGAVITYGLFELFIRRREQTEAEKARLIAELGNSVNDVAKAAADKLRQRGWLEDGSLHEVDLSRADLSWANLSWTDLREADLSAATLRGTNLRGANLPEIGNIQRAVRRRLSQWVGSTRASLLSPWMSLKFDEDTTLPDGTEWMPDTDMARFTDPEHPDLWRSDDPNSPACRDKDDD